MGFMNTGGRCGIKSLVFSESDCPSTASEVEVPKPQAESSSQLMPGGRPCKIVSPVNRNRKKPLTRFLPVQPLQVGQKAVRVFMPRMAVNAILAVDKVPGEVV
jgi:hypothetical protein